MGTITTKDWIDLINENKQLHTQLAKANERVEELELTVQKQSNLLEFYVNDYASKQLRKEQNQC